MSGDRISNCHDGGWGRGCVCVTGILSVVRSEAAQHLYNAQNSILSHQMIWPNVNSAEVEKPWDNVFLSAIQMLANLGNIISSK